MLDPSEPFFLRRGHHLAVFDQTRRRVVERGIDSQGVHATTPISSRYDALRSRFGCRGAGSVPCAALILHGGDAVGAVRFPKEGFGGAPNLSTNRARGAMQPALPDVRHPVSAGWPTIRPAGVHGLRQV